MGIGLFGSSCSCSDACCAPPPPPPSPPPVRVIREGISVPPPPKSLPNPDPSNFNILKLDVVHDCTIVKVHYPDCTNYEGHKILVFDKEVSGQVKLDPHFCEHNHSPIARFEPTKRGWRMAVTFCRAWNK